MQPWAPLGGIGETLAGYKGYGYAAVVEILSAALQSGIFLKDLDGKDENGNLRPYHLGHFFIAIDTDAFMGAEAFKKDCREYFKKSEKFSEGARTGAYLYSRRKGA